ncbi:conserved hypothetical protein [uncultured delta proteobacterium]|uniref:Uncharacterized protein n=1 Tax=uncultured delta proteobacterium TaxID=34034 RepID=A0A212KHE6_9DELT|nr:conserved hypothetical protein [uncultured delta proteobacterium]
MTRQEDTPTQIYVPALRRELAPRVLPDTVRFMDPGLPQTASAPGFFHPPAYPFSRAEAAGVLAELLTVGETLDLSKPSASQAARVPGTGGATAGFSGDERTALARFSTGEPERPTAAGDPKIAAQKVLLLAWDLETRLLEIASLHKEVAEAVKPLAENLHGDNAEAFRDLASGLPGTLFGSIADLPEPMEPDWRLSLMAIAAFAPEGALLVTCHTGMRNAMLEAGMLHPLPEDVSPHLAGWPESLQSRLLWAKTPLWRILGHSREPENAPWLRAAPEIIVCPA